VSITRPVRVLQVLWRLSRAGGVPGVVRGILEHHDRSRIEVHVCTVRPLFEEDDVGDLGCGISYHPLGLTGNATPLLQVRAAVGIARLARALRPDVIHVHSGTASHSTPAGALAPRPAKLIEVHDAPQAARISRGNLWLEHQLHRRLGFQPLVHSSAVRDGVAEAWGLDPVSIPVVPLGVDVDAFAAPTTPRAEVRAQLGLPPDAPLVLYVARLVDEKRPLLFLEVAAEVHRRRPGTVFALVGGGSLLERCRARVRDLGLDGVVALPGFVDDLPSTYHASDVFLSTSRYEGFGLAIAEAMASGLSVVTTDVGGVSDVVGDVGVLEPSPSPERLAGHVAGLIDDAALRARLGRRGRDRAVEVLDVRGSTRCFEDLYLRVAGR
jgi:glycosyltransferase involved in cell wall biosynthesis